ncbi:nephrocystin-3-like [Xenia sp. Carnegie-2017]|uniref:nephrocystin-3-like n=1 Tax=Xenia sp. Carnegie-2017 TaxID=2897299 RepID=UPI001F0424E7|nr:nephrocystin-3-like [Xenia sp. Carnegie-2017]XP_046855780.1 nephrocystin-3-like [Xenia sp. Carnegie-2017]XP_046855781.1 nephrocystin-3-like [Xenia sp. Carnegie-2017]XP_046855782.1 nephrocystin-3-like [Xenia sp. Carnegie-2017]XP_046855783.1 nephrocystin-3-like [Xenia sp. Carnegie-2017]XP_046855785.1 nephrocystin-3-like [Xenia sp. Carnegie-2017]
MESKGTRNLSYIQQIINVLQTKLAQFFIKEWNSRYKSIHGEWDDTKNSGKKFCTLESGKKLDEKLQLKYQDGDTSKWGCTTLFDAILYSNSIGKPLDKKTKDAVLALRGERNNYAHWYEGECSDDDFDKIVNIIEKSFQDLKFSLDEIIEIKNHRNSFNSFQVLPSKPNNFIVERTELRDKIIKDLEKLRNDNNDKLTYFYITGNPGSGKSQLARQVCENISCDWKNRTSFVMTLDGKNEESLLKSYCELGYRLNCDKYMIKKFEDENCSIADKVKNLRSLVSTRLKFWQNWLIIVDNVVQLSKIPSLLPQVGDPMWINGQIIVTIQNTYAVPQDNKFNKHISIRSGMNDRECFQLLKHYIIENEQADDQLLNEVSHVLDRQPLALAAAGFYVSRVNKANCSFTWRQYLKNMSSEEEENMNTTFVKFNSVYPRSMLQASLLAVRQNAEESSILANVVNFFSVISFDPIPRDIIAFYVQEIDSKHSKEEICLYLKDCSLFLHSENNDISLHRIVHKAIVVYQSEHSKEENEMETIVDQICKALYMFKERNDEIKLMPHLEKIVQLLKTNKTKINMNTLEVFEYFVERLRHFGKYNLALELLDTFKSEERCYNKAWYFSILGVLYHDTGKYSNAKNHLEKALEIRKQSLGPNHVDVATSLSNLGLILDETGNYDKAIEAHEKALEIRKQSLGPNHVDVAASLNNLGLVLKKTGNYDKAKDCHKKALKIRERSLGPNHVDVAGSLNNLGMVFDETGNNDKAIEFYEKALEIRKQLLGPNHVDVASCLNNLGTVFAETGNYDKAKEFCQNALEIRKQSLGPNHVVVAASLVSLGVVLHKTGKYDKAKEFYEKALEIQKQSLGPNHVDLAMSLNNLGSVYEETGNYDKAKEFYEKALEIQKQSLGPNHVDVAALLNNLGNVFKKTGNYDKAIELYEKALEITKQSLGPNHVDVAMCLNNLGTVFEKTRNYHKALEVHKKALKIHKQSLGPNHVRVANSLNNLGVVFYETGKYDKAKEFLEKALEIRQQSLGPIHVDVAASLENLVILFRTTGNYDKAIEFHEKAKEIRKKNVRN